MFQIGSNHNAVKALKTFLNSHPRIPVSNLKISGIFDSETQTALINFQKYKRLIPNGRMDFTTQFAVGSEMHSSQIKVLSTQDAGLLTLLRIGQLTSFGINKNKPANNKSLNKVESVGNDYPKFEFFVYVRAFALFDWFGAGLWKGDDRSFSVDPKAKSKVEAISQTIATYDNTEYPFTYTRESKPVESTLYFFGYEISALSECYINDRDGNYAPNGFEGNGVSTSYDLYGNNDGFPPFTDWNLSNDIDLHPYFWHNFAPFTDGMAMTTKGSVTGDQFPAAEAFMLDTQNNAAMLGVYAVTPDASPFTHLPGNNFRPMIDINVTTVVKNGLFQGVLENGNVVSLTEYNQRFLSLSAGRKISDREIRYVPIYPK